jgi:serine protease Do
MNRHSIPFIASSNHGKRSLVQTLVALVFGLVLLSWLATGAAAQTVSRETLRDYDVVNGRFFTQTGGSAARDAGYAITDEGGVPLWSEFQRLGGAGVLGYPVTQRFTWNGFVVQATQKAVLQWRPDLGRVVFINLLDEMTEAGMDEWLLSERMIPAPASFPEEKDLPFDQVVQRRLALLDAQPALRVAFFAAPNPLEANGLPVAPAVDFGPAVVLRAQRRAFQLWKVATPFARVGDVTVVNAGDLGKEAALYPETAMAPEATAVQLAAPQGTLTRVPAQDVAAMRRVVEQARPAIVKLTDGGSGWGSGVIIDPGGTILTNSHVVLGLRRDRLRAELPDGRSFPAVPVGADDWTDVAVVKIDAQDLPSVPVGSARSLATGQRVVGIGYAPVFPGAPSAKAGVVRSLSGQIQVDSSYPLFDLITSDTYLNPGDSGGALLDLSGRLVGINSAIGISRRSQALTGYSIPIEGAQQIAEQLLAPGSLPRPQMGVSVRDVTPALVSELRLPVTRGLLLAQVQPGSPAEAAGLVQGDVIVGIDGRTVDGTDSLRRLMVSRKVGDTISLSVARAGEAVRTVSVTLAERPPLV